MDTCWHCLPHHQRSAASNSAKTQSRFRFYLECRYSRDQSVCSRFIPKCTYRRSCGHLCLADLHVPQIEESVDQLGIDCWIKPSDTQPPLDQRCRSGCCSRMPHLLLLLEETIKAGARRLRLSVFGCKSEKTYLRRRRPAAAKPRRAKAPGAGTWVKVRLALSINIAPQLPFPANPTLTSIRASSPVTV